MTVYLVGAGPGDPGLMTARALELIAVADVIVFDRLIPATALDGARPDAMLIYAGKEGGGPSMPQAEISRLLVSHGASAGIVVRLKGGDPFVFGRGGEEAEALREAGVAFEVVPGVTAGVAGPAYAGIPVTHRDAASAVAFVTGHEDPTKPGSALDWGALAAFPGTLVFYMGIRQLPLIASRLVESGRDASEPAAVVERGTLPDQRVVIATVGDDRYGCGRCGCAGAGACGGGRCRGSAGAAGMVRVAAARGPDRRGDAGARPGERPGEPIGSSRRGGRRGAGNPDRAARRTGAFGVRIRPRVPDDRRTESGFCSHGCTTRVSTRARWRARGSPRSGRGRRRR